MASRQSIRTAAATRCSPWSASSASSKRPTPLHRDNGGAVKRPAVATLAAPVNRLRDRDFLGEIHVLNRIEEGGAFFHRPLERLAPGDEAHSAGALVDHGGLHGFLQVAFA